MPKREKNMDIAKGIAMLAVIVGHITGGSGVWKILYSFHLPLFFIVSGYFFLYDGDFKKFIIKKSKSCFIPYICCMLINTGFLILWEGENSLFADASQFLLQIRFPTLWFLSALYFGLLIFWLVFKICNGDFKLVFIICTILGVLSMVFEEYFKIPFPWNFDTALIMQFYLAIGYWIKESELLNLWKCQLRSRKITHIFLLGSASIICTYINFYLCHEAFSMAYCEYGIIPLTILASCFASFAVLIFSITIEKLPVVEWIGRNSFVFFAFHKIVGINIMYYICGLIGIVQQYIRAVIVFGGTLAICYIIHIIIDRSKLNFLIGR